MNYTLFSLDKGPKCVLYDQVHQNKVIKCGRSFSGSLSHSITVDPGTIRY
jgi:hypothetical protein